VCSHLILSYFDQLPCFNSSFVIWMCHKLSATGVLIHTRQLMIRGTSQPGKHAMTPDLWDVAVDTTQQCI
jgi:hypothetical protein